jgi:hypothetical protein
MNRHLARYMKIIDHYKIIGCGDLFSEKHHITPRCLGGTNEPENILRLPARAHIICHYLLHKAYPQNRALAKAFAMMAVEKKGQDRKLSSRMYEQSKLARSNALKGIPRPEWVKEKLRKPKSNKSKYFGNTNAKSLKGFKHKPRTEEHTKNQVAARRWYDEGRTKEARHRAEIFRQQFVSLKITRKEFYALHPNVNFGLLKKYLKGL